MRRTVAALVQPLAGRVQTHGDIVLHYRKLHLIRLRALGKPVEPVHAAQPLHDSLLDDPLTVGHGEERGVETVPLDGERPVTRDDVFPAYGLYALKKLLKRHGAKAPQLREHALTHAQIDIRARDGALIAGKIHAPVLAGNVRHAQTLQLVGDGRLQPQKTGDTQLEIHFRTSYHNMKYNIQQNF